MSMGGGGGSETESNGENFSKARSSGQSWNSSGSDNRGLNVSQSRSNQGIWSPQADALTAKYGETGRQYGQAREGIDAYTPEAQQNLSVLKDATAPVYANQAQGGEMGGRGVADTYQNSMNQSLNGPSNMQNAYRGSADQLNQMYRSQANDARNDMMNSVDSRAAASGMSGGSRHGTMMARGNQDINSNLQNQMAMASDRDVDRGLNVANAADQALMARQGMMQGDISGINAAQQGTLGQANNMGNLVMQGYDPSMMGMRNLGMGSQIIGGPTTLTQTANDSLGLTAAQQRAQGGSVNQSAADGYSYTGSAGQTDPNWKFALPSTSAPT